ncbi:MAG TPA: 3D domain-containing protein [Vicinamibacterales bacterium]|jgi:3D (Asp-Asp-Asp) domain-containing protein|nr:3D domain-containing protein [Vicinamibacterales bacterium]
MRYRLATALAVAFFMSACAAKTQPRVAPAPEPTPAPTASFMATAYCRGSVTASGDSVRPGVIAADPAVLPLGSVVRITGLAPYDGTYTVLDTGAAVRGRRIDLYMADCSAARRFGRRMADIKILK